LNRAGREPHIEFADPMLWISPSGETLRANRACVALAASVGAALEFPALFGEAGVALLFEARAIGHTRAQLPLVVGPRPRPTFRVSLDRAEDGWDVAALLVDVSDEVALRQKLLERARVLSVINDLAAALSGTFELEPMVRLLHEQTQRIMRAENFFIALFESQANRITFPLCIENGARLHPPSRPYANAITEYVMRTGQPLVFERDVMARARALGLEPIGRPCQSLIATPITVEGESIGVMMLQDFETRGVYGPSDVEALTILAAQAAFGIQNIRLLASARLAYHELSQAQARLLESERVRGVTETVGALNHEVNNPLAAISGNAQLLLKSGERLPGEVRDKIQAILEAAHRIQRVTARMETLMQATSMPYPGHGAILDVSRSRTREESAPTVR